MVGVEAHVQGHDGATLLALGLAQSRIHALLYIDNVFAPLREDSAFGAGKPRAGGEAVPCGEALVYSSDFFAKRPQRAGKSLENAAYFFALVLHEQAHFCIDFQAL